MTHTFAEDEVEALLSEGPQDQPLPQLAKLAEAYIKAKSMAEEKRLVHQAACILKARAKREDLGV